MTNTLNLKLGDRITFKAVCRWNTRTVTRKVKGLTDSLGWPIVRYEGCGDFVVRPSEIRSVSKGNAE